MVRNQKKYAILFSWSWKTPTGTIPSSTPFITGFQKFTEVLKSNYDIVGTEIYISKKNSDSVVGTICEFNNIQKGFVNILNGMNIKVQEVIQIEFNGDLKELK